MPTATATVAFTPVSPAPSGGYRLRYRIANSGSAYTTVTGTSSPIVVSGLPEGTYYEYILDSDCGSSVYSSGVTGNFNTVL